MMPMRMCGARTARTVATATAVVVCALNAVSLLAVVHAHARCENCCQELPVNFTYQLLTALTVKMFPAFETCSEVLKPF